MQQSVLLADIDNTLYDWPSFFAPSLRAMIHVLSRELRVKENQLYEEFKTVFKRHGSLEYAFVVQELDCVRSLELERVRKLVGVARGAFNRVRRKHLAPYPGVRETLEWLHRQDVLVVGITNSPLYRAQHRLFDLGSVLQTERVTFPVTVRCK
jgi:phosphoglycolate phosphatase